MTRHLVHHCVCRLLINTSFIESYTSALDVVDESEMKVDSQKVWNDLLSVPADQKAQHLVDPNLHKFHSMMVFDSSFRLQLKKILYKRKKGRRDPRQGGPSEEASVMGELVGRAAEGRVAQCSL